MALPLLTPPLAGVLQMGTSLLLASWATLACIHLSVDTILVTHLAESQLFVHVHSSRSTLTLLQAEHHVNLAFVELLDVDAQILVLCLYSGQLSFLDLQTHPLTDYERHNVL